MIGSSTAARRAGQTPNATPTNAENAKAATIADEDTWVSNPPLAVMIAAPPVPKPMPMMPPRMQSTTASIKN